MLVDKTSTFVYILTMNTLSKTLSGRQEPNDLRSLLDIKDISARRQKRCFHRVYSGLQVEKGQVRMITLTSSRVELNERFQGDFRKLRMRLLRRNLLVDYIRTPEYTESGLRHEHILFRGSYIAQRFLAKLWGELHESDIIDIRLVKGRRRIAVYLAKYMSKAPSGRYSYSWGWVWKGFATTWKYLKRVSYQNGWKYKELLTIWRMMIKLKVNLREELEWQATNITLNVVSAEQVSGLIRSRNCLVG